MIYPDNFENKIGFDRIREILAGSCLFELGREQVRSMHFYTDTREIKILHRETSEFLEILNSDRVFPVDNYYDLTAVMKKIHIEGTFLEVHELFELKLSQEVIRSILVFFKGEEGDKYPVLKKMTKEVNVYPFILESVNRIITSKGKIKDNASPDLGRLRKSLKERSAKVSSRMHSILKRAREQGLVEDGTELTMRNGRMVIPLRSSDKRKIGGLVHDESASGKTSFVEPAEIVEMNNEIKELEYAEKREIIRILISFADSIRPYLDEINASFLFLGVIDFIRSKAIMARKLKAAIPGIEDNPAIEWEKAIHPLLYLNFSASGKEVVPLDIRLNEEKHILLISGPNAGGKSVCLQTVGLLQYMFQCGLPVPVNENSRFGVFNKIFLDFGDEQSIENDLSTYSSHLLNMKYFLKNADDSTLILIDEFGTGTEPMLGGAIAQAILGRLNEQNIFGIITTHYSNLKHFASSVNGIENGAMLFDHQMMKPLYKLFIGKPGSSFAFEIARGIGLPENILKDATKGVGEEHIHFDKHLREIARDKKYWENKRSRIRKAEKKLEEILEKYAGELSLIKSQKKEILKNAQNEAEELLSGVNRKIEKTIRVIKETQAEKEQTRRARKELEKTRENLKERTSDIEDRIAKKIRLLKDQSKKVKAKSANHEIREKEEEIRKAGEKEKDSAIGVGDKVKLEGQEIVGEVLEIHGRNYIVAFGHMTITLPGEKIKKIGKSEFKDLSRNPQPSDPIATGLYKRRLSFHPNLDVRGKRADEALQMVQDFIDNAVMVESKDLSILHGKGNGILRQMIREFLSAMDIVHSYHDEHPDRGGAGITLVRLDI